MLSTEVKQFSCSVKSLTNIQMDAAEPEKGRGSLYPSFMYVCTVIFRSDQWHGFRNALKININVIDLQVKLPDAFVDSAWFNRYATKEYTTSEVTLGRFSYLRCVTENVQ